MFHFVFPIKGNQETKYLEEELELKHELEFEFNSNKGFNCLVEPTDYCLSDAKGRPSTVNKMAALAKEVSILSSQVLVLKKSRFHGFFGIKKYFSSNILLCQKVYIKEAGLSDP